MSKTMRAVVKKSRNDQFYFVIVANNGETIAASETYTQKHNALHTINLLSEHTFVVEDETLQSVAGDKQEVKNEPKKTVSNEK